MHHTTYVPLHMGDLPGDRHQALVWEQQISTPLSMVMLQITNTGPTSHHRLPLCPTRLNFMPQQQSTVHSLSFRFLYRVGLVSTHLKSLFDFPSSSLLCSQSYEGKHTYILRRQYRCGKIFFFLS